MYLKSRTGFDAGGFKVSTSGMGEKSSEAGAGNSTDSEKGIVSETVTGAVKRNMEPTQRT